MMTLSRAHRRRGHRLDGAIRGADEIGRRTSRASPAASRRAGPTRAGRARSTSPVAIDGMPVAPGDIVVGDGTAWSRSRDGCARA